MIIKETNFLSDLKSINEFIRENQIFQTHIITIVYSMMGAYKLIYWGNDK